VDVVGRAGGHFVPPAAGLRRQARPSRQRRLRVSPAETMTTGMPVSGAASAAITCDALSALDSSSATLVAIESGP